MDKLMYKVRSASPRTVSSPSISLCTTCGLERRRFLGSAFASVAASRPRGASVDDCAPEAASVPRRACTPFVISLSSPSSPSPPIAGVCVSVVAIFVFHVIWRLLHFSLGDFFHGCNFLGLWSCFCRVRARGCVWKHWLCLRGPWWIVHWCSRCWF